MVVHIVMIKLKDEFNNQETKKEIKSKIESLLGVVPSLKSMEVGINFADEERAMDISLTATFDDKEGLREYAVDKYHQEVIEFIKKVASYTKVVDYEKV